MPKEIYCRECNIYLGEIRDARLRKNITYLCNKCEEDRQYYKALFDNTAKKKSSINSNEFDFLSEIFKVKK